MLCWAGGTPLNPRPVKGPDLEGLLLEAGAPRLRELTGKQGGQVETADTPHTAPRSAAGMNMARSGEPRGCFCRQVGSGVTGDSF